MTILDLSNEQQQSNNFEWINSWEIKYKGELYDVIKTVQYGQITRFICVWDQYEKSLHQALKKHVNQQLPTSGVPDTVVHQIFKQHWIHQPFFAPELSFFLSIEAYIKAHYTNYFTSYQVEVDVPPPQLTYR
ncbi:hypothetical protein [Microscilla marina]|uniref:hypothetical protein n=1 Tax=Microscilla marina TaxID=1027 RepID=UPI0012FCC94F|nr:hypothetical protein [Microscilla marina]